MNAPRLERTIPEMLVGNLARGADDDFLTLLHADRATETLSYGELLGRAAAWANLYRARDLGGGDRVIVILRHSVDLYAAYLGAICCGVVPAMFAHPSPKVSEQDYFRTVGTLLGNSKARLLVTYPQLVPALAELVDRLPTFDGVLAPDDLRHANCSEPKAWPDVVDTITPGVAAGPDDTAFLQYSSGTTGLKKGVAISHRALLWQIRAYGAAIGANERDVVVSWLPLYHDMGLVACLFLPILLRCRLVAMSPFDWVRRPALWAEAVTEYRATLGWLPNFAYNFMASNVAECDTYDLASLRGLVNCSEPISAASHDAFVARFAAHGFRATAISVAYAMAETTFAATSGGFGRTPTIDWIDDAEFTRTGRARAVEAGTASARRLVSSGQALPETEVVILDDHGNPGGDRRLGEIALWSPCLLAAYDDNPTATATALQDGRYLTGDLGYLADGELFVVGRKTDMIIVGGQNIYPQDIEALLNDVVGVVAGRVVVIGIDDHDAGTQKLVVLAEATSGGDDRDLVQRIHQRIAERSDVAASDIRIVAHKWLEKTTSGKFSRNANRAKYLAMISAEQPARAAISHTSCDSLRDKVRQAVRRELSRMPATSGTKVDDNQALISSGLIDSFGLVNLLAALEAGTGTAIPDSAAADMTAIDTIDRLVETIDRLQSGDTPPLPIGSVPTEPGDIALIDPNYAGTPRCRAGFWTWYYQLVFRRFGIRFGRGLRVLGPLLLRLDGDPRNIQIGDNVTLMPWVDLKVREQGRIILGHGTMLDSMVRLVAANQARVQLGDRVTIGMGTIVNAGADVVIGTGTMTAGYCGIVASDHNMAGRNDIRSQGFSHDPIYIGADVWLAASTLISRGSRIGDGAVISAQSVVKGDVPAFTVAAGNPARVIKSR